MYLMRWYNDWNICELLWSLNLKIIITDLLRWFMLMQRGHRLHLLPWFFFQQSLRKALPWQWLGSWVEHPFRAPWNNPINDWYIIIIYGFGTINNRCLVLAWSSLISGFFRDDWPEFVKVDCWLELVVSEEMELSHTSLSEVSWMTKILS